MLQIGELRIAFLSHTTFLFGLPDGTVLLTDPYFCGEFEWEGHTERHMQRPDVRPDAIARCSAIFVSHIHGDHCDPAAIRLIASRTGARVLAPHDVLEQPALGSLRQESLCPLHDGQSIQIGSLALEILGGYDDSFDARGRMNKFSLLLEHGATRLWFSGDCHALPPSLPGRTLDAIFCWTYPDLLAALQGMKPLPRRLVMMHHDLHVPGDFWCNRDPRQDAHVVSQHLPGVEVLVPDRLGLFSAFDRMLDLK